MKDAKQTVLHFCPQDEKEQLLQYRSTVAGLMGRAKNIVQLRPRNPESPIRSSIPVKAVCDYRQIEVNASSRYSITSVSFQNFTVDLFWIFFSFRSPFIKMRSAS